MKFLTCLSMAIVLQSLSCSCVAAVIHVPADQPTIQAGIDAAAEGDTVLVADGTYTGDGNRDLDYHGKSITVMSENGRDYCIIDCQGTEADPHRGFYFHNFEDEDATIRGFTIRNGYAEMGGGICLYHASPAITGCAVESNTSDWNGAGLNLNYYSNPIISDCVISGNESLGGKGGGLYGFSSAPEIIDCTFSSNISGGSGGGICLDFHNVGPRIIHCRIIGNTAGDTGGGIRCDYIGPLIGNCIIAENSCGTRGGGICCDYIAHTYIADCTIYGNTAGEEGGGICTIYHAETLVTESILWNNNAVGPGGQIAVVPVLGGGSELSIQYSDVHGGMNDVYVDPLCTLNWGSGMIDADPLFVSGPDGDFYLSQTEAGQEQTSPCVDAGSAPSSEIFYTSPIGGMYLSEMSTRSDRGTDSGLEDLGYHYYSQLQGVRLKMPYRFFIPRDHCDLTLYTYNYSEPVMDVPLCVILEFEGQYWFWDGWTADPDWKTVDVGSGIYRHTISPEFRWPDTGTETVYGFTFWGAMTNPEMTEIQGGVLVPGPSGTARTCRRIDPQ